MLLDPLDDSDDPDFSRVEIVPLDFAKGTTIPAERVEALAGPGRLAALSFRSWLEKEHGIVGELCEDGSLRLLTDEQLLYYIGHSRRRHIRGLFTATRRVGLVASTTLCAHDRAVFEAEQRISEAAAKAAKRAARDPIKDLLGRK